MERMNSLTKALQNNMPQAWGISAWIIMHIPMLVFYAPDDFWTYTAEPIYSYMIGKDASYNQVSIRGNDHL